MSSIIFILWFLNQLSCHYTFLSNQFTNFSFIHYAITLKNFVILTKICIHSIFDGIWNCKNIIWNWLECNAFMRCIILQSIKGLHSCNFNHPIFLSEYKNILKNLSQRRKERQEKYSVTLCELCDFAWKLNLFAVLYCFRNFRKFKLTTLPGS